MKQSELKGIQGLYEECCYGQFYEWIFPEHGSPPPLAAERYICTAPVWYNDAEALTLIEDNYNSSDEMNSTWKLCHFAYGLREKRLSHRPYKVFQLESDDDLVVVKCKIRPILLIKKVSSDWRIPGNTAHLFDTWLCLPVFSYKNRHTQEYVIKDQSLKCPHHFYFPPGTPGIDNESAGKLIEMQFIPEGNLTQLKKMCDEGTIKMQRPFRVTEYAFHALLGHITNFFPYMDISGDVKAWYELFAETVQEQIPKIIK